MIKGIIREIARTVVNLPGVRQIVTLILRLQIRPMHGLSIVDMGLRVEKIENTIGGKISRLIAFRPGDNFTASDRFKFKLGSLDKSDTTRKIFWLGLPDLDVNPNDLVWSRLQKAKTIVDVGANIGIYSLVFSEANPGARIIAFEPDPEVSEIANRNFSLNGVKITLDQRVVTDRSGPITFTLIEGESNSTAREGAIQQAQSAGLAARSVTLEATTLDRYASDNGLTDIDFVKMDTEGTEIDVLRGMVNIIARYKPDIFCEVIFGHSEPDEIAKLLKPHGYRFYRLGGAEPRLFAEPVPDPEKRELNFLFSAR